MVGAFRLVCVPVAKTLTGTVLGKSVPGGTFAPVTPAPPNPSQDFTDQFAARTLTRFQPFLV